MAGLILAAIGVFAMALPTDFYIVTAARAISGIGQGMLFIGVQSLHPRHRLARRQGRGARPSSSSVSRAG